MEWTHRKKPLLLSLLTNDKKDSHETPSSASYLLLHSIFIVHKTALLYVSIKFQFLWFPPRFFFSLSFFHPNLEMDVDDANGEKKKKVFSVETSWQNRIVCFSLLHFSCVIYICECKRVPPCIKLLPLACLQCVCTYFDDINKNKKRNVIKASFSFSFLFRTLMGGWRNENTISTRIWREKLVEEFLAVDWCL